MNILLYDLGSSRFELNEPIGLGCLESILNQRLPHASVTTYWAMSSHPKPQLVSFDVIGISVNLGMLDDLEALLADIFDKNPTADIVLGGIIPTFAYENILRIHPGVYCVIGEGESAIIEICNAIFSRENTTHRLSSISNLAFVSDGNLVETTRAREQLSSLPNPTRKYLPEILTNGGIARIEGSRGCPWGKCSFCCVTPRYGDPQWQGFDIDKIYKGIVELSQNGIRSPYFTDEDFFGEDYSRAIELAEKIRLGKIIGEIDQTMDFYFSMRVKDALSIDGQTALQSWNKAGLREVFLGVESCSQEQLKRYKKGITADNNIKAIRYMQSINIGTDIGFILFDPEMVFNDLIANTQYIKKIHNLGIDSRSIKSLRAQPKTDIVDHYNARGYTVGPLDVNNLTHSVPFVDEKVLAVKIMFEKFENEHLSNIYRLQSYSRGESQSKTKRHAIKQTLDLIRRIETETLLTIIEAVMANKKPDIGSLSAQRQGLIENGLKDIAVSN